MSARPLLGGLTAVLLSSSAFAHRDTPIELQGRRLVGLPSTYSPAEFDQKTLRLRIRNHEITLVGIIGTFFEEPHELRIFASWYHEREISPPYIGFRIKPKGRDYEFDVVLALDTLRVISATIILHQPHGTLQDLPIELGELQQRVLRQATKTVP